jgi:hypothetical protein
MANGYFSYLYLYPYPLSPLEKGPGIKWELISYKEAG